MGTSGQASVFILAVFDPADGSVWVSQAQMPSRMQVMKNIYQDLLHLSQKTEVSVKKPGGNQAPY